MMRGTRKVPLRHKVGAPCPGLHIPGDPYWIGTVVSIADIAEIWQSANVSVIPILANQTKRPAVRWSPYQATVPTLEQVNEWWGNGKPYGLALICGAVSGNLEMTEIEGRANTSGNLTEIENRLDELGGKHIWELLTGPDGYLESSPSGGLHLLYRISDHEVPGNTKIANAEDGLVLAETRGHGGYVIVAPTPGICHPSGKSWDLVSGRYGKLPEITWVERSLLHEALRLALGGGEPPPEPAALPVLPTPGPTGSSAAGLTLRTLRPGERWAEKHTFEEFLNEAGWVHSHRRGPDDYWCRPGKSPRDGHSAVVHDDGLMYVWTTSSTDLEADHHYTKFGAWAFLFHGGNMDAAAADLVAKSFVTPVASLDTLKPLAPGEFPDETYTLDDVGNAMRLARKTLGRYHWVWDEKCFYRWNDQVWSADHSGGMVREVISMTDEMTEQAKSEDFEALRKWAAKSRTRDRIGSAITLLQAMPGMALKTDDFNPDRHLLNVGNGILDLRTRSLSSYDPAKLMTRMFNASYMRNATCPEFLRFIKLALPDNSLRAYVQRALGYSLLGNVDQRSIFWIYGPPGTGKSTLMDVIRNLFGDYGLTAAAGAFRAKTKDQGPTNDLHGLRGKRFVTTSETAESTTFDEDLLKRLSGRDRVMSRELYQVNQEWTPECVLWMATNNAPRFTSDDDAIWRRTKLIPFLTVFTGESEVPDFARKVLGPEQDGILNWLLVGLSDYLAYGLGEPSCVQEAAHEQRAQSDSVARFVDERVFDGVLVMDSSQRLRASELYRMYADWAKQSGERPIGPRRFITRMASNFPALEHGKTGGHMFWNGVGRAPGASVLGWISPSYLDN